MHRSIDACGARRCPSGRGCGRTGMPSWEGEFRVEPPCNGRCSSAGKSGRGSIRRVRAVQGMVFFMRGHWRGSVAVGCHRSCPSCGPGPGRGGSVVRLAEADNPDPIGPAGADTSIVWAKLVFVKCIRHPGSAHRKPTEGRFATPSIGRVRAFQRVIVFTRRCDHRGNAGKVALGQSHLSSPDERTSNAGVGPRSGASFDSYATQGTSTFWQRRKNIITNS